MKDNEKKVSVTVESVIVKKQSYVDELIRKSTLRRAPASINGLVVSIEQAVNWDYR